MKKLACVLMFAMLAVAAMPAQADGYGPRKIESFGVRAMGGVDLALDLKLPANGALMPKGWFLTILGVETISDVSQIADIMNISRSFFDYQNSMKKGSDNSEDSFGGMDEVSTRDSEVPSEVMEERDRQFEALVNLAQTVHNKNLDLDSQLRVDVLRLDIGSTKFGRLTIGAYAESEVEVRASGPEPDSIVQNEDGYADIGEKQDVVRALGRGDVGGQLAYGRAFNLPHKMQIAAGLRARVFHRVVVPNFTIQFDRVIKDGDDIIMPDGKFYDRGTGFGLDAYTTFAPHDPIFDTRVAVGVDNAYGQVWYDEAGIRVEPRRYSVGLALAPFHKLKYDGLMLGADAEDLQKADAKKITWQTGMSLKFGSDRYNFIPAAGFVFNRSNMMGDTESNVFTAGATTHILFFSLGALYELDVTNMNHSAGIRFAIEI